MSMKYYYHLGPHLVCLKFPGQQTAIDVYEITGGRLYGLSEVAGAGGKDYVAGNVKIPGIDRRFELTEGNKEPLEFEGNDQLIEKEMKLFKKHFAADIEALIPYYQAVNIAWGLIPYWS